MNITIDTTRCIGCGMCAYAAPQVFRIVGRHSTLLALPETRGDVCKAADAANGCPVNAIRFQK